MASLRRSKNPLRKREKHNGSADEMSKAIVFDFDDTIANTTAALEKARLRLVHEVYGAQGIRDSSALRCWRSAAEWFGSSDIASVLGCIGAWHKAKPIVKIESSDWLERYELLEVSGIRLVPHVSTLLDSLSKDGYAMAVVTNGDPEQQKRKFRALNLEKWFPEECLITCDVKHLKRKPAPDGVLEALKRLNAKGGILVGDRRSDIIAGFLAGCTTIRILRRSGVARQGPVWLGTIGDPDCAVKIIGIRKALYRMFKHPTYEQDYIA